ncbi:MAG: hypothetical protein WCT04_22250 [Planctomycetota bacterium]
MSVKLLNNIPAVRRDRLFAKIRRMVNECDAVDRSLDAVLGEHGILIDETMESIVTALRKEFRRSKKSRVAVAA